MIFFNCLGTQSLTNIQDERIKNIKPGKFKICRQRGKICEEFNHKLILFILKVFMTRKKQNNLGLMVKSKLMFKKSNLIINHLKLIHLIRITSLRNQ